jgi:hypothetical protein
VIEWKECIKMAYRITRSMSRNYPKKRFHQDPYPVDRRFKKKAPEVLIVRRPMIRRINRGYLVCLTFLVILNWLVVIYTFTHVE